MVIRWSSCNRASIAEIRIPCSSNQLKKNRDDRRHRCIAGRCCIAAVRKTTLLNPLSPYYVNFRKYHSLTRVHAELNWYSSIQVPRKVYRGPLSAPCTSVPAGFGLGLQGMDPPAPGIILPPLGVVLVSNKTKSTNLLSTSTSRAYGVGARDFPGRSCRADGNAPIEQGLNSLQQAPPRTEYPDTYCTCYSPSTVW